ncbi:alpha-1,3-glucan synthase Ags2 [Talaromyces proteolyticus]|uniref:alpha-1,3-glucan synthase n=1 Tax=Talaromyces proteolyticus TaxID=1131652 RepID=A0AAD4KFW6_9EURO|nr:alpha-1,3-glucan synthase Ags2 [Talaromyces proteolyticus]KAH8691393.1 alpha-1,3-glucan synthase Ags2 [Talaromyces proteolyticus]
MWAAAGLLLALLAPASFAWPYDEDLVDYNLNENKTASTPADYWGQWPNHQYHPSPENWRFPIYTLFLDRFVNGDPSNDNINGTNYEHDLSSTQMRHGGDVLGMVDTLDYLQGMGIKAIYLAGTVLMNQPWGFDGYSALDTTLLDQHYGDLATWRSAITEIHKRGMYVIFDNTLATMGDLLGFDGYLNSSAPFSFQEYQVQYKTSRKYIDFAYSNTFNESCIYPRFYNETGYPVDSSVYGQFHGCYESDFDQFGDVEAFGVFPDYQRELAKFASVQDRLREWVPSVREKLIRHACIIIASLDIDGFRFDKATQATVDALGDMSESWRQCARAHGKNNFFLSGEVTGGNTFGSIYIGRGRQPDMQPADIQDAIQMTNESSDKYFIRGDGQQAIDGAAFHYSVYRTLTRFLGLDGNLAAGYDLPTDWVTMWNLMLLSNDLVNANTGKFDPRHLYGTTNQDVFRWPAIESGTERMLLGMFITTLHMPGAPLVLWGEEQGFYILDATADNYIYGRQSMSPATAWWSHGCFKINVTQYFDFPLDSALNGCEDISVTYDHRNPAHPIRNVLKHMFQLRQSYPVLNDGYFLQSLSKQTHDVFLTGSNGTPTETGMWSVLRGRFEGIQDLVNNQSVWLLYQNDNVTVNYQFDCSTNNTNTSLIAPFDSGTTVKNLFYPYDEQSLQASPARLGIDGSTGNNGCLDNLTMVPWDFRAYVPKETWVGPNPMITGFTPGHDARILSNVAPDKPESIPIEIYFSEEMSCESVTESISINSTTEFEITATLNKANVHCENVTPGGRRFIGEIPSSWVWRASMDNVYNGIHRITVSNATSLKNTQSNAIDHFLLRVGQQDNPMIFHTANYSTSLLHRDDNGTLYVQHHAAGADMWRHSTNWGSSFSTWMPYKGGNNTISELPWSGTSTQEWPGKHVRVEYFNRMSGSSDYVQEGDTSWDSQFPRRFPHLFWNGPYNQYGFDAGLKNEMSQDPSDGLWKIGFLTEWPAQGQVNVWGINPDGRPDQGFVFGDADGDSVLDRLPPSSLSSVSINITNPPPRPYLGWQVKINDGTQRFELIPVGSEKVQIILFSLFWILPILTASFGTWIFMKSFYRVKLNHLGVTEKKAILPLVLRRRLKRRNAVDKEVTNPLLRLANKSGFLQTTSAFNGAANGNCRRMVMIATMEYDIEDWEIKIKIGGLGVMAQLMGKNLSHQDLIWVVPCVGDVDYPEDQVAEPMFVTVLGNSYEVKVQYHVLRNITYVLLDAPVFRQQSKTEPYPARMDDLDSAIYYSAWNQCIAEAMKRFPIDLYHINDYHGSLAPLYILPQTIPSCLSLHNAEFQGLWPMRTQIEKDEVCSVFNLDVDVATRYVQFGEVFNLLHAGASYLRVHQQGFGAVGVSKKYGKRSYARYPIFWGLKKVGNLPNPDPSDTAVWDKKIPKDNEISIDVDFESARAELKRQAQEWAGLEQNPDADLLVFVGRWSMQKGIDLIADVMPAVLDSRPNVQLICVGPVIDLYGKFAALKLDRMMQLYPGRVYSRPQFTALPPCIFSGAEFALIPSRDEPFGLVAVEFGRKGALGIGARVGGLGQMPGWWYTVESTTTSHLLHQFKLAIDSALNSKVKVRAEMRARSAKQRFPVAQWVEDLEILQSTAIRIHTKEVVKSNGQLSTPTGYRTPSGASAPGILASGSRTSFGMQTPPILEPKSMNYPSLRYSIVGPQQRNTIVYNDEPTPGVEGQTRTSLSRQLSLGVRSGPGHSVVIERRNRLRPKSHTVSSEDMDSEREADYESEDENLQAYFIEDEYTMTLEQAEIGRRLEMEPHRSFTGHSSRTSQQVLGSELRRNSTFYPSVFSSPSTPDMEDTLVPPSRPFVEPENRLSNASVLSLDTVVGDKKTFKLQKVDPFFTDSTGEFYRAFEKKLEDLSGSNSDSQLCIEEYLVKSEKKWFERFRAARLGRDSSPVPSIKGKGRLVSPTGSVSNIDSNSDIQKDTDEFLLGADYKPPTGLKKWMQLRIGDWPVYSLFLGLGQIIAANSYQITLLTGAIGQTPQELYAIATTYLITSIAWWFVFRSFKSVVALSTPWFFYGLAFILIGVAHVEHNSNNRAWIQNVASGVYATASSSGSIFFSLNFGDESGAPVKDWVFRACVIQGTQQLYVVALWYWGSSLSKQTQAGITNIQPIINSWKITAITVPIAMLLWSIGLLLVFGLPDYYRQTPGKVASFYKSVYRRKIILWFFVAVIIQNFFLSAPYGRNWSFLWSSNHASAWEIVLLVILFFVVVWSVLLGIMCYLSKSHSWILPVFAIGLGAPRWAQIWWGTSNVGQYIPWVSSYVSGALVSRSLWLWLGVLDSLQGVGFGMILLQTLTRLHICFVLLGAQVLGSIATIVARAAAPNKIGPGDISPDIGTGISNIWVPWFWVGLFFQILICGGFFLFFRKEQLSKP